MTPRRALTPADFWALRFITEMRLSPDGGQLAYVLRASDREANKARSAIWLLDIATGQSRRLTSGAHRDASPRWSPDGRTLAFISDREDDTSQLYTIAVSGGEARRRTLARRGAGEPFWSPDGAWIGFTAEVRPGEEPLLRRPLTAEARERERQEEAERPRHITRLQYRWDGHGYFEGRAKLFRVWLDGDRAEQLTEGDYDDAQAAASPDGRAIVFVSDREDDRDANMTSDLWLLDLETRHTCRLTCATHAIERPVWSPDGARIACLATPKIRDHSYYNIALMVIGRAGGAPRDLLAGRDLSAEVGVYNDIPGPEAWEPAWSDDSAWVYTLAQRRGGVDLLRVATDGPAIETVIAGEDAHTQQFALADDGAHIYTLRCDPTRPWDIWERCGDGSARPLTAVNTQALARRALATPERFEYPSFDGWRNEGWLYRPEKAPESGAPLALKIHGGPHGAYGQSFFLSVQSLVSQGYAVLYINPRGSVGYGEAFAQACDHDWGGGDYRDIMAGVDAALARGGLDSERMAVFGGSYGGYMTNWIITHSDRFRAAVTINSVNNLYTSFGTGDIDSVWAEGDYGWPWERAAFYRDRSPVFYAGQVTTPTRIIAAENDYRCPIAQSEELYTWIKRLGHAPVDFIRMPGASHSVHATPRQRVRALELEQEWIMRYCPHAGSARQTRTRARPA